MCTLYAGEGVVAETVGLGVVGAGQGQLVVGQKTEVGGGVDAGALGSVAVGVQAVGASSVLDRGARVCYMSALHCSPPTVRVGGHCAFKSRAKATPTFSRWSAVVQCSCGSANKRPRVLHYWSCGSATLCLILSLCALLPASSCCRIFTAISFWRLPCHCPCAPGPSNRDHCWFKGEGLLLEWLVIPPDLFPLVYQRGPPKALFDTGTGPAPLLIP